MFLGREGQRERTCRIPGWIVDNVPDVDVIGFQVSSLQLSILNFPSELVTEY